MTPGQAGSRWMTWTTFEAFGYVVKVRHHPVTFALGAVGWALIAWGVWSLG